MFSFLRNDEVENIQRRLHMSCKKIAPQNFGKLTG